MDVLLTLAAVVLPALGGFFWLAAIEALLLRQRGNLARLLGYGTFLGFAVLLGFVHLCHAFLGALEVLPVLVALVFWLLLGLVGFVRFWLPLPARHDLRPTAEPRWAFWLFCGLVGLAVLHLSLASVEVLYRPVFPWDAWLSWMYRAKAWFYAGGMVPMDTPAQWARGEFNHRYAVVGQGYPTFVPVLGLWTTSVLGRWSETLVNLPYLLCGPALWAGMYGQCREAGLRPVWCALAAYILISIPLIHTHLALAGQADIWMAGFAGLGFVAVLRGLQGDLWQLGLGLAMVALGIVVKSEGGLWLLAALLVVVTVLRPRWALAVLGIGLLAALAGAVMGTTVAEVPGLGLVGIQEGRVYVPLLGSYQLMSLDLLDDYLENFFVQGSWHLLWPFTALAALALVALPAGVQRRSIVTFFIVFVLTQVGIFELTEQGRWADDWTAINRLPLHFVPALVFCMILVFDRLLARSAESSGARPAWWLPGLSLLVALAVMVGFLAVNAAGGQVKPQTFTASQLTPVVGRVSANSAGLRISEYADGIALLSSGSVAFSADDYTMVSLDLGGNNTAGVNFFWRLDDGDPGVKSAVVPNGGQGILDLTLQPEWNGMVTEVGLVFFEDEGAEALLGGMTLAPPDLYHNLDRLIRDWAQLSTWDMRSVHWLPAGSIEAVVPLPVFAVGWIALALVMLGLLKAVGLTPRGAPLIAMVALGGWLLLDIRWLVNTTVLADRTVETYVMDGGQALELGDDRYSLELATLAREVSRSPEERWTVLSEDPEMRFQVLRVKYLMLPQAATTHEAEIEKMPSTLPPSLLVLRDLYRDPGIPSLTVSGFQLQLGRQVGRTLEARGEFRAGFVFSPKLP